MSEKTLEELICIDDPGWPEVQKWIAEAKNHVEVLPASDPARSEALLETQVTTRSIMGAIVYETGGLLIDHGWLRVLGSSHEKLKRTMPQWTLEATGTRLIESPEILIADLLTQSMNYRPAFVIRRSGVVEQGIHIAGPLIKQPMTTAIDRVIDEERSGIGTDFSHVVAPAKGLFTICGFHEGCESFVEP